MPSTTTPTEPPGDGAPLALRHLLPPGCREGAALCRRPPDSWRVVVIGDSYAYGLGVACDDALPAQLARRLNRGPGAPHVEVLNLGLPGLNIAQEWSWLRQLVRTLELDLVILTISSDDATAWTQQELAAHYEDWSAQWKAQWDPRGPWVAHALTGLLCIIREARDTGAEVAVTFYEPVSSEARHCAEVLDGLCARVGVPFVDLSTKFERFAAEMLCVSAADSHPSPMAHRIAAIELEAGLRALLPARVRRSAGEQHAQWRELLALYEQAAPIDDPLAYRALAARLAGEPSAIPELATATRRWRAALNRLHRAYYRTVVLRSARIRLGGVREQLFRLERGLLLAQLDVLGAERVELQGSIAELDTIARAGCSVCSLASPGPGAAVDGADDPLHEMIEGTIAELLALAATEERLQEIILREIAAVCADALALCARHRDTARGGAETQGPLEIASSSLRRVVEDLQACSAPHSDDPVSVAVEIHVPVERASVFIGLIARYTVLHPYTHQFRQMHYVVADGTRHSYRIDLPPGTIGYVELELETAPDAGSSASAVDGELIEVVSLVRGQTQTPHEAGSLLWAPLPAAELDDR